MACATLKRSLDFEPMLGIRPAKRRRCTPFCGSPTHRDRPGTSSQCHSPEHSFPKPESVFPDVVSQKLTAEHMVESIKAEIKRLQKSRQMEQYHSHMENSSDGNTSEESSDSPRPDKPLFTFRQVGMICERMLREKESEIRQEYDNVLSQKLAEQYDAFVKFTYDQIQRNYQAAPSYLS